MPALARTRRTGGGSVCTSAAKARGEARCCTSTPELKPELLKENQLPQIGRRRRPFLTHANPR
jgi:hypothetical protein